MDVCEVSQESDKLDNQRSNPLSKPPTKARLQDRREDHEVCEKVRNEMPEEVTHFQSLWRLWRLAWTPSAMTALFDFMRLRI